MTAENKTAFVLGATADIGLGLCERLLADGWRVAGAGREAARVASLASHPAFRFIACDLASPASIAAAVRDFAAAGDKWSLFVSSAGTMEPIGPFFDLDFDLWERSVTVNSTAQLRVLHGLWPHRAPRPHIMLMAGGGTNNPFTNYSAYCMSKIALIKMCELIDDETEDANIFIVGPGYVRTRIHDETLRAGAAAGGALGKTKDFLDRGESGTSLDEIYSHMNWCMMQGREVAGGRNFSTVHDAWRDGGRDLAARLAGHPDYFRLRRRAAD